MIVSVVVWVIFARGALSRPAAIEATRAACAIFAESGIEMKAIVRPSRKRLPRMSLKSVATAVDDYAPYFPNSKSIKGQRVLLLVPPALTEFGDKVNTGQANRCGSHGVVGVTGGRLDAFGIAHEMGHLLGAGHVSGIPGALMNPDPNGTALKNGWRLIVDGESLQKIEECL